MSFEWNKAIQKMNKEKSFDSCKKHEWVDKVKHVNWNEYYQWTECKKCEKQKG